MPQMNPINWLSLFMMFISIFILFCMLNYFNFIYYNFKNSTKKMNLNKDFKNWKW